MFHLLSIILLAISLSMDAFSLSLVIGTLNYSRLTIIKIGLTVGVFHFIMPLLGDKIGESLLKLLPIKSYTLAGMIFMILAIQMLISTIKESESKEIKPLSSYISILLFALTVSIDSFSIGISFSVVASHHLLASTVFMILSTVFTISGLVLGKKIKKQFGKYATITGSIILFILAIKYII